MPIKVPDNLPALETLNAEQVDVMPQEMATRQDIRPLKLLCNLMPKKRDTEIQFARLFGNTPLQIEMILMTTASYTPRNTEPGYLRRFYRQLDDVRDEYFDALIVTGAPIETLPFEKVNYWQELSEIMNWSRTHCFRRRGSAGVRRRFYGIFSRCQNISLTKIIWCVRPPFKPYFRAAYERVYRSVSNAHLALHNESY